MKPFVKSAASALVQGSAAVYNPPIMVISESDPMRQWFLYYQEKEIGPLSESDVLKRLANGEINATAYVYSEGMPDWALISDTPVLSRPSPAAPTPAPTYYAEAAPTPAPAPSQPSNNIVSIETKLAAAPLTMAQVQSPVVNSAPTPTSASTSTPAPTQLSAAVPATTSTQAPERSAYREPMPAHYGAKKKSFLLPAFLILILIGAAGVFLSRQRGGSESSPTSSNSSLATKEGSSTLGNLAAVAFPWSELMAQRESSDDKAPPFRLASKNFGDRRPIIVGALSPLVKAESLNLAIYSDDERSMLAVPRLWLLRSAVVDGYFSAGPFTISGKELPPGRYHVMAATKGTYLGEVTFEIGPWPTAAEITENQSKLDAERLALAQKEKAAIEVKMSELTAAASDLRNLGRIAAGGTKKGAEWKKASVGWSERVKAAMNDQRLILAGPMFYGQIQNTIYEFMGELNRMYEFLDEVAKQGAKGLGQRWVAFDQKQAVVAGEVQSMPNPGAGQAPLRIDPAIIKRNLQAME